MESDDTVKILLFRGGDCISWLVKAQTRSPYSHAALLAACGCCVIESYPFAGVRMRKLTAQDIARIDAFDVPGITQDQWQAARAFAYTQMGRPYDIISVLRFVDKLPASENGKWFCSEIVHESFVQVGHPLLERINSAEVSPAMIAWSPRVTPRPEWNQALLSTLNRRENHERNRPADPRTIHASRLAGHRQHRDARGDIDHPRLALCR